MQLRKALPVALAVAVLAPAGAAGYQVQGRGDHGGREITYYNAVPQHKWAVEQAVRAWNESGAQVEFTPAPRGEAEVVIQGGEGGLDGRTETTFRSDGPHAGDAQVSLPSPGVARGRDGRF